MHPTRRNSESRSSISEGSNILGLAGSRRKSQRRNEISIIAVTYSVFNEYEDRNNATNDQDSTGFRLPNDCSKSFNSRPSSPSENKIHGTLSREYSQVDSKKGEVFRYYSTYGPQIEASYISAISRFRQHLSLLDSIACGVTRCYMHPESLPGSLYYTAWLGVLSSNQLTARAAYSLLGATVVEFDPEITSNAFPHPVSGIPHLPIDFLFSMSNNLSQAKPEYVMEIFHGCATVLEVNCIDG